MRVVHLLGIAGVEAHETPAARLWAKRLEWPMVTVVVWILLQWYLEETQAIDPLVARVADWLVWLAFFVETVLLGSLVRDTRGYLLRNWMNPAIVIFGFPLFWQYAPLIGLLRGVRLLLVVMLLVRLSKSIRKLLARHQLGHILAVAFLTIILSGVIISHLDPSIGSVWDGMWWAWVTMATVGYGDVVPHSTAGRLFASLLIIFGVVVLSMLTASLAAFFIGGDVEKVEREEKQADRQLREISERLERIERLLEERPDTQRAKRD